MLFLGLTIVNTSAPFFSTGDLQLIIFPGLFRISRETFSGLYQREFFQNLFRDCKGYPNEFLLSDKKFHLKKESFGVGRMGRIKRKDVRDRVGAMKCNDLRKIKYLK